LVNENDKSGELILVATPIGHLDDFCARAVQELATADWILCEDTRHSSILLQHYDIHTPTTSYGSHNLRGKIPWIVTQLEAGKKLALICDAGTPGVSDPGSVLVGEALKQGYRVRGVPGPSALLLALTLSGLPTDRFVFEGFLPHKKGRQTRLRLLAEESRTMVLYESPHRIQKTLCELLKALGNRKAAVARELTKIYEEILRGNLSELNEHFLETAPRGEFVIIVAGTGYRDSSNHPEPDFLP
jgi:16S rRNA (cytidine1402-2'-O)-methyltransferase